ncbi:hypothetical protein THAOC_30615, partial [Thalassiosira oceanica]
RRGLLARRGGGREEAPLAVSNDDPSVPASPAAEASAASEDSPVRPRRVARRYRRPRYVPRRIPAGARLGPPLGESPAGPRGRPHRRLLPPRPRGPRRRSPRAAEEEARRRD